ncbi:ATP-binding cassette domain-containing protein [Mycobacterium servetii]|uniref:ATP-binding cassette domain-containing protein n=1 Tax=Mycobacterium servetii TaxID=3237418 RepID=A0ABV4BZY6_9MYCO
MRPDAPAYPASPLTVWVGSMRYVFTPGRDVIVGQGRGCDVPLDRPSHAGSAPPPARSDVVLRFADGHWVAVDTSPYGMFVDGARVTTVDIRDGQAIAIGDPQRGPRLVFQLGAPARPSGPPPRPAAPPPQQQRPKVPPPSRPRPQPSGAVPREQPGPVPQAPTQRPTQRMPVAQQPPARPPQPGARPAPPEPRPVPPPEPPRDEHPKNRGLIKRMTDATRRLRAQQPSFRSEEADRTYRLPLRPGARTTGVAAYRVGLAVDGREVISDVSFTARPGTLTAVIGPSAPRNSALLDMLAGTQRLDSGVVTVDGHDVHAEPAAMRTRIGIVPRDDRLHRKLTVAQSLRYAAELRLPPETTPSQRDRVVEQVLEELELTPRGATPVAKLPPELRRCVSLAIELLSRPTLLVVDGVGAGLDAAQENQVMAVLRRQADLGCAVVVAMASQTSLTQVSMCDQAVVLTGAGTPAYVGTPLQAEPALGTADFSRILAQVSADPDGAHRAFRERQQASAPPARPEIAAPWPAPADLTLSRQTGLVIRRQVRQLLAGRTQVVVLALLPMVFGALMLLIPGDSGLGWADPSGPNRHEAVEILAALNFAAVVIGTVLTLGNLVTERLVYRRERSVGLSPAAYLAGKVVVFAVAAAGLTAVLTVIVLTGKGGPVRGAVLLGSADLELYVSVAVTAVVSAIVGLALSARAGSPREVLALAVPVVLASLLFAGGLVPLVGTWGYDQISWFVPAQWGFAASASTVDLRRVDALAANIQMWTHYVGWWAFDMNMLVLFGALWAGLGWFWLLPRKRGTRTGATRPEQAGRTVGEAGRV